MKSSAFILTCILALLAACGGFYLARYWHSTATTNTASNQPVTPIQSGPVTTLPDFALLNHSGALQSIYSWPQHSLVINFWASWCAPCRREIPLLNKLQHRYAAAGFQVVGVAIDFRQAVLQYATQVPINYPLLIGEQDGLKALQAFGIEAAGLPITVFTDQKNNIVTTYLGELHEPSATLILTAIQQLNQSQRTLEATRRYIAAQLQHQDIAATQQR